jgi:hypothetical protein
MSQNVLKSTDVNNLARIARSKAFDLIVSASSIPPPQNEEDGRGRLEEICKEFTETAAMVLEGEKDPRCLLRGLEGLRLCQVNLAPICLATGKEFPSQVVLDTVRVYYPVTFEPPKNDKYGITNKGLRNSLNAVLSGPCLGEYDGNKGIRIDLGQAVSLVMDRVGGEPEDGERDITNEDREKAVEDVRDIINLQYGRWTVREEDDMVNIRGNIIRGAEKIKLKSGSTLMKLVTEMATALETQGDKKARDGFVGGLMRDASFAVMDSPESVNGRANVLLTCALAKASPKAMSECLTKTAPRLLAAAGGREDRERAEAAADAIARIYNAASRTVVMEPCPVKERAKDDMEVLKELAVRGKSEAGVRAVAAITTATKEATVEDEEVGMFCERLGEEITRGVEEFEVMGEGERKWMKVRENLGREGRIDFSESVRGEGPQSL